ncbi:HEPN domain-containing protein [bacterium CPR1]|nr:HEPN domain-containing protein [bacterium CPR1]
MTDDNRRANVALEWKRVEAARREVALLVGGRLWEAVVSRAYYGMFHAARAMAFSEGLESRTHAGLVHLLSLHLVQTGRFPAEMVRILNQTQRLREDADDEPAVVFDEQAALEASERLERFRDEAEKFLSGWLQG